MTKEMLEAFISTLENWSSFFTLLVVIGVGGELIVHLTQSHANKKLIAIQHKESIDQEAEIARLRNESATTQLQTAKANEGAAEALRQAANAEENLGNARKDAALANERAAEANKIAEGERLARLKIEEKLAPRRLNEAQQERIEAKLRPFANTPYELAVNPVPEAIDLLSTVDSVLRAAGWGAKESAKKDFRFVFTLRNGSKVEQVYTSGIAIQGTKAFLQKNGPASEALVLALRAEGLETNATILPDDDPSPEALHVVIGSK
jgi:hypothetical protein